MERLESHTQEVGDKTMKAYCEKIRNEQEEEYYQLGKQVGRQEVVDWLRECMLKEHRAVTIVYMLASGKPS